MNNLNNLYPCLESIKKYTTVSYETLVVAYLFSKDNLEKVKNDFPWVTFIESNEIRGFSENNNLALRQAKGKYCFVLNDDTEMKMDVIGRLMLSINSLSSNTCIVSPKILIGKESKVLLGKPKYTFFTYFLGCLGMANYLYKRSFYTLNEDVFLTYNISGAAFLIKSEIFKQVGWFDEKYFFCPEDIALSTLLNKKGYKIYVDSEAIIYHFSGGTWSSTITATKPASVKGEYYFYCGNNVLKKTIFIVFVSFIHFLRICYWLTIGKNSDKKEIMIKANRNAIMALLSHRTPKQLFCHYYKKLKESPFKAQK